MDLRYEMIQRTQARVDLPEGMVDRLPPDFRPQEMGEVVQVIRTVHRVQVMEGDEVGSLRLRTTYESAEFESTNPLGRERYDSRVDAAATSLQSAFVAALVGLEVEGDVARDGTPVPGTFRSSKTAEEIVEGLPMETRGMMGPAVSALMDPDAIGGILRPGTSLGWPSGPLEVGDRWEQEGEWQIPMVGGSRSRMVFTLVAVENWEGRRVARIEGEISTALDLEELTSQVDLAGLGDLLNVPPAHATSVLRFDLDEGILVESVLRLDISREAGGMKMEGWSTAETRLIR